MAGKTTMAERGHVRRDEWTRQLRQAGGDPDIRAWWRRTIAA